MSITRTHTYVTCPHDPDNVVADILTGDGGDQGVEWCRTCGAYRRYWTEEGTRWCGPVKGRAEWEQPDWCPVCRPNEGSG